VRQHTTQSAPENSRWRAEVNWTSLWVGVGSLSDELGILDLISCQRAGDENLLSANNGNLLATQELLGADRSQATQEVSLSINNGNV